MRHKTEYRKVSYNVALGWFFVNKTEGRYFVNTDKGLLCGGYCNKWRRRMQVLAPIRNISELGNYSLKIYDVLI